LLPRESRNVLQRVQWRVSWSLSLRIYQDSTSVISLVMKGGGIVHTKHLCIRMNLCREAVDEKRIRIAYVHTTKMLADGLTKPLEGSTFKVFMKALMGLKKME
jgi:hypothetical protein